MSDDSVSVESEETLTFAEIYASLICNDELVLTLHPEDVERTKTGIKNFKNKQNLRLKKDNLPTDDSILEFEELPSTEFEECIDLKILLKKPSTVRIKKIHIPDGEF